MKNDILLALFLVLASAASAKVTPSSLIGDNMVLQQNTEACLWGTAQPGATVEVTPSWDNRKYTVHADKKGDWKVCVATPAASFESYDITISDGEPLAVHNVLVGEVWLASGQSNMGMGLGGFSGCNVSGGYEEVAFAGQWADRIRFFTVPVRESMTPLETTPGAWAVPSVDTAADFSAVAWFFAKQLSAALDVPVGIVANPHGGARVESWMPRELLEKYPDVPLTAETMEAWPPNFRPMLRYNAMFFPVRNYTVKGIIWYQGCSNVAIYESYAERLRAMVERWRSDLGGGDSLPFYAVEIAPFQCPGDRAGKSPYLREEQWKAIDSIPNSAMAGTNDLVQPFERYNIHPSEKKTVGHRLCNLALNRTYGKRHIPVNHPRYKSHRIDGKEVRVAFSELDRGICRDYDIRGFELAGADRVFHPADSARYEWQTGEIIISSEAVKAPVAVRYCFKDFETGTVYGGNWLPLIPFRSDNW